MPEGRTRLAWFAALALVAACGAGRHEAENPLPPPAAQEPLFEDHLDFEEPETSLDATPQDITSAVVAAFKFSGRDNEGVSRFRCRWDAEAWDACRSPAVRADLADGEHVFGVKAVDQEGNEDASPASFTWKVDTTPPDTSLRAAPPASTDATTATFHFNAADMTAVVFECSLDTGQWSACASPASYAGLTTGPHDFRVRARDVVGNLETTPAAAAFTVIDYPAACFTGGDTPQLDLSGPDVNWTWNDPHVLKVGPEYWMYASATDTFNFPVRLYRLTSTDGTQWARNPTAPVLADAAPGAWDAGGLETPSVVYFAGQYHLFYTAYPYEVDDPLHSAFDYRVGHAVSNDGLTFARAATVPVVAPSGTTDADPSNDWYAFIVGEPGAVVHDGELWVYFTAVGADAALGTSLEVIGLVRSLDGVSWSSPELVLKPDQTLYPRGEDWVGYSTPNALSAGGGVHLFFDVAHQPSGGDWKQLRLHHAYSADGTTNWLHDAVAIAAEGDFAWAVDEVRAPDVLLDGETLRLYFAGHELNGVGDEHFAIGMMTCVP